MPQNLYLFGNNNKGNELAKKKNFTLYNLSYKL